MAQWCRPCSCQAAELAVPAVILNDPFDHVCMYVAAVSAVILNDPFDPCVRARVCATQLGACLRARACVCMWCSNLIGCMPLYVCVCVSLQLNWVHALCVWLYSTGCMPLCVCVCATQLGAHPVCVCSSMQLELRTLRKALPDMEAAVAGARAEAAGYARQVSHVPACCSV